VRCFIGFLVFMAIWIIGAFLVDCVCEVRKPTWLLFWGAVIFIVADAIQGIIKSNSLAA
jgi:hypothetical protein